MYFEIITENDSIRFYFDDVSEAERFHWEAIKAALGNNTGKIIKYVLYEDQLGEKQC